MIFEFIGGHNFLKATFVGSPLSGGHYFRNFKIVNVDTPHKRAFSDCPIRVRSESGRGVVGRPWRKQLCVI